MEMRQKRNLLVNRLFLAIPKKNLQVKLPLIDIDFLDTHQIAPGMIGNGNFRIELPLSSG